MSLRLNTAINVSSNLTLPAYTNVVNVDTNGGNVSVTMPATDGVNVENGTTIWISHATGGNICTVKPSVGTTIDSLSSYNLQPKGQIKLVLIGSVWRLDYTSHPIAYYECMYLANTDLWTVTTNKPFIAFHENHNNWFVDTITVSTALLGGRGASNFRLLRSGVTVLNASMSGSLLCQTFSVNAKISACDIWSFSVISISSPALTGASFTFKVVPYL